MHASVVGQKGKLQLGRRSRSPQARCNSAQWSTRGTSHVLSMPYWTSDWDVHCPRVMTRDFLDGFLMINRPSTIRGSRLSRAVGLSSHDELRRLRLLQSRRSPASRLCRWVDAMSKYAVYNRPIITATYSRLRHNAAYPSNERSCTNSNPNQRLHNS